MNWLLTILGMLPQHDDREKIMARVRSASDEHSAEAVSSSERIENVIFHTRVSSILTSINTPVTVDHDFLNRAREAKP